ncbi:hypothetical protein SBA1_1750003 [Candidatus Sulfotelmatobacter kueseliae]|uniref:Uncharacterized protein n=1 Tax=Candidatus Sulfotelmatobacter kueseliae TaxID=2042962 RepID=A0A2U3KC57_9BACT|nr:hypothetical protein SBA1_1750003 [Candidatus Sulfotelmatobacter kueseliae]
MVPAVSAIGARNYSLIIKLLLILDELSANRKLSINGLLGTAER